VTRPGQELTEAERAELFARRKKHVWKIVLVMTITSCAGTTLLLLLLWFILQKAYP
jgi:hypothetical protein